MAELVVAVGGVFLAPLLQVAFYRIAKSRDFIKLTDFFKGKKAIKIEKTLDRLHISLQKISVVLEDAEDKQKTTAVRTWLGKVRAEANYADDLLDEFNTECLRLQLDKQNQATKSSLKSAFINLKLSFKPSFIKKLMPKLRRVTATLEEFAHQIKELGLREMDPREKYPYRVPSSSVVDKSQFFGRDGEKEKMIERVLSDGGASDVSVIAITGMGGIGKTTLAQLVYNNDRVKENFQTRAWVCVSEEYDALRVTKALLMEVNSTVVDDKDDFNRLQVKLKETLADKCFLIILDDIWNENTNDWSILKTPLSYGSKGRKIIVTTRNEEIALTMQTEPFHKLKPMPEDQSWSLFNKQAFDTGDHTPLHEFERVGKEIVKKCKGLPLAIKMIAGALRPQRDINVWQDFLSSEDWVVGGDILPALSLSYKHLPPHLKGCFAFCALFHKDVPFDKDEVVLLWMANDLVKPSTQKVGRICFEELKSRSFFESVDEKMYLMHDLVNDLARSLSGNTCIRLEHYQAADRHQIIQQENLLPPELLHFSYLANSLSETFKEFQGLSKVVGLRTFLPVWGYGSRFSCSDMFPRLKRLRALNLSQHAISVVPDSIGDLKHLRFLNLDSTNIEKLPNAICKCLNLQTLILKKCYRLVELPEDMRHLINLRHVDVRGVGEPLIKTMATWLRMFQDIQNISVVVDKIQGSDLELLVQLQVCDSLNIIGLGDTDVATIERAKGAGFIDKDCIENLSLEWSGRAEFPEGELNKFAQLKPHTNTKKLSIEGYKGTTFSDWLGDFAFGSMESLSLINCKNCLSLPPLGQLTGLRKLNISGMDGISEIGKEFYGDASTSKPFQALEELEFRDMAEWTIWNTHSDLDFSSLKSFTIRNCPKLVNDLPCGDSSEPIPLFSFSKLGKVYIETLRVNGCKLFHQTLTSLKSLRISNCNNILSFPEGGLAAPILKELMVAYCSKMKSLPARMHTQLPLLTELGIEECPEIECFPEGGLPSSLESLSIINCSKMKSLPARMHTQLPLLSYLRIGDCPEIECLPEGGLPSSLETLHIENCSKMRNCQTNWGLQTLPSLKKVSLRGFEDTLFPEEGLLPTNLQELHIMNFSNLETLNEKGLQHLSSLQSLHINYCHNLKYLPQQNFSSSFSEMSIWECPLVKSFPEGLASSLSYLSIYECPKLAARIEREKGEDWPKVSHIPIIEIDFKRI